MIELLGLTSQYNLSTNRHRFSFCILHLWKIGRNLQSSLLHHFAESEDTKGPDTGVSTIQTNHTSLENSLWRTNCDILMPFDVTSFTRTTSNLLFRALNETCVIYIIRQNTKTESVCKMMQILTGTRQCPLQWCCVTMGNLFPLHK